MTFVFLLLCNTHHLFYFALIIILFIFTGFKFIVGLGFTYHIHILLYLIGDATISLQPNLHLHPTLLPFLRL